jgi:CHAT domain-containing protein
VAEVSQDSVDFVVATVQLIARTQGDPKQVYKLFQDNIAHLNKNLPLALRVTFEAVIQQNDPSLIAEVFFDCGNLIQGFPLGNRMLNIEIAITAYELALTVYTREAFPQEWATTQNNLAAAYNRRIWGDRGENLEQSIFAYEAALQVRTRETFPEEWANTQNNLGAVYSERIRGDRAENIEQAIVAYQLVLQVRTHEAFPERWASTQNNLGAAYSERIRGDRAENLEQAIEAYEVALQVRTREAFPLDWASTQNNLALAYSNRIRGDRAENLEHSIMAYELALQVRSREAFPQEWASIQNNLALAYSNRIRGDRAENLESAIAAYELALQVRTHDFSPLEWARTQNNLALAYLQRIRGDRAENLERSIAAYKLTFQIYTLEAFPQDWASTQNNLAAVYSNRIRGDRGENLERSITAYELALQIRSRDLSPQDWASTQNNLGLSYANRVRGDREENLEDAIRAYKSALQVYTYESFPQDWATTNNNLANAFLNRIYGDREENLEDAIRAYNLALQVYTHEAFPQDWSMAQNNLANAYSKRLQGDREENLEQAIAAYELALQVRTRDAFPQDWSMTQNNLALAYAARIRGDREENLKSAVVAYELALQIRTCEASPHDCRRTSRLLANLQADRNHWQAASTAYQTAIASSEILYQSCFLLDTRASELTETDDLPRRAAYTYAKLGNLKQAILTLETNRARGLGEALDRDRANLIQLQQLAPSLYEHYQELTNQIRNIESQERTRMVSADRHSITPEDISNTAEALRAELESAITKIRQVSGYGDFLMPSNWQDITSALHSNNPIIYLVTTPNGTVAIIITPDHIETIWNDKFTDIQLREIVHTWFKANDQREDCQVWLDTIDVSTNQLWDSLMGPIVHHLETHSYKRATLIPTGLLGLLPLHAAWTQAPKQPSGRRYALDDIHFTYAPNAKSLTSARTIAARVKADTILAIDEPKHRYLDPATGELKLLNALSSSKREVVSAIATFSNPKVLSHEEATRQALLDNLPSINVLHCSCHGTVNFQEPLLSGLAMTGDGETAVVTLRDFLDLKLTDGDQGGICLAILSACKTGLPGLDNIDEVVSLPIGLLQAGVAGVVSSLWSVDDVSTMMLLTRFYDLWRQDKLEPAIALNQAQRWMAQTTDGEKARYCGLFTATPDDRTYAHPFYWAAFNYLGV